jgi:hypothetical protein
MLNHPKTVLIENPAHPGGLVINEKDFKPDTHKLWKPAAKIVEKEEGGAKSSAAR